MTSEPENVVLVYLRRIDKRLERVAEDVQDLKIRMTGVEEALVGVTRSVAGVNRRLDRVEERLERVERRFDLREDALMEDAEKFKDQDD